MKFFGLVITRQKAIDARVAEMQSAALETLADTRRELQEARLDGECSAKQIVHLCQEIEWMRNHQLLAKRPAKARKEKK